jgi:D-alanyl-D-alanine dipeptidase
MSQRDARLYWIEQMEAAASFMERILDTPIADCGETLVSLPETVRRADVEILFSDTRLAGHLDRQFYLREGLIDAFLRVGEAMNSRGWILKVEDAYRSMEMQRALGKDPAIFGRILNKVIWEQQGEAPPVDSTVDSIFDSTVDSVVDSTVELMFRRLSVLIATRPKLGTHMSGSALDISVVDSRSGHDVDRGGPYLEMSERTPMSSPFVSAEARRNRGTITRIMSDYGFVAYPYEFWHYSQGDVFQMVLDPETPVARYTAVDFDPHSGQTVPMDHPLASLHSLEDLRNMAVAALEQAALKQAAPEQP